jgi:pimeloyl-ACP methyl ester carboxylesterase
MTIGPLARSALSGSHNGFREELKPILASFGHPLQPRLHGRRQAILNDGPGTLITCAGSRGWSNVNDFVLPETRYALSGDVNIAYQTIGDGPLDLIMVPGVVSHMDFMHEFAGYTAFLQHLSKFARVIAFDKRGQGLSDRISGAPSLEQRMDDVRAVMDEVGSSRAALMGFSEGCAMSAMFAASYPERVSHLICFGGFARYADLFGAADPEQAILQSMKLWGTGAFIAGIFPNQPANHSAVAQFAKFERLSSTPGTFKALSLLNSQIDVRPILPTVRVPTLVLHRATDAMIPVQLGRDLASRIPGAKYIEYPSGDHSTLPGRWKPCMAISKNSLPGIAKVSLSILSGFWPRSCLPTLWIRPATPSKWAIRPGDGCWIVMINWRNKWLKSIAVFWSSRPGTAFWRRSMDRAAAFAARWRSDRPQSRLACRCAQASIPRDRKSGAGISAASRCTPQPASWRNPSPARFLFRGL